MELTNTADDVIKYLGGRFLQDVRSASAYLSVAKGREKNIGKSDDKIGGIFGNPIHDALTFMDRFVQDFLCLQISREFPEVSVLLEEESTVRRLFSPNGGLGTVLIDPIDGTKQFSDGGSDYSILVTYIFEGKIRFCTGIYPESGELLISCTEHSNVGANRKTLNKLNAIDKVACHYRITKGDNVKWQSALECAGKSLVWNGNGFYTNLTAAQMVIRGEAEAFVCVYTAAHDALAPVDLIRSAGGVARRYSLGEKWSSNQKIDYSFFDVQESRFDHSSPRVRLIGARNDATANALEKVLESA